MAEVNAKEYVGELVKRAKAAQKEFERTATDQLTIDKVVRAIGKTIYDAREELAKDAHEETKYGTIPRSARSLRPLPLSGTLCGVRSLLVISKICGMSRASRLWQSPWGLLAV